MTLEWVLTGSHAAPQHRSEAELLPSPGDARDGRASCSALVHWGRCQANRGVVRLRGCVRVRWRRKGRERFPARCECECLWSLGGCVSQSGPPAFGGRHSLGQTQGSRRSRRSRPRTARSPSVPLTAVPSPASGSQRTVRSAVSVCPSNLRRCTPNLPVMSHIMAAKHRPQYQPRRWARN